MLTEKTGIPGADYKVIMHLFPLVPTRSAPVRQPHAMILLKNTGVSSPVLILGLMVELFGLQAVSLFYANSPLYYQFNNPHAVPDQRACLARFEP